MRPVRRASRREVLRTLTQLGDLPAFVAARHKRRFVSRLARLTGRPEIWSLLPHAGARIRRRVTKQGTSVREGEASAKRVD